MPAPISVIIPVLNDARELEACLPSLLPGMQADLIREVIVVDGGSEDQSILTGFSWGSRIILSGKGRGRQLKTGGQNARGDWFLFIHADTQLSEDWPEAVAQHISASPHLAAAFQLKYRSEHRHARWLEHRANRRARHFGLPYGDQGLLISRALYEELGGFSDIPLMEDVDMVRRIGRKRLNMLPAEARTSAAKYERDGWRRRAYANALLITRYFLGASPDKLARKYR